MPPAPRPGQQPGPKQITQGRASAVPCPWCSQPNDFRVLMGEDGGGAGWGSQGLEPGTTISCDKCGRKSRVLAIEQITVIKLGRVAG